MLGGAALARQGGIGSILNGGASAPAPNGAVTYNVSSPLVALRHSMQRSARHPQCDQGNV